MRRSPGVFALAAAWVAAAGCGSAPSPPVAAKSAKAPRAAARITQFYATAPVLAKGEQELLCYGVENARAVRLEPPAGELSAALARCVEVNPASTTRYTLTAEGFSGPPATQELTVTVGPPHVKIIDVTVSSLTVTRGNMVSLCYHVENAASVEIEPIHFRGPSTPRGCGTDTPQKTTTYIVTAKGAEGSRDTEKVTVQVH
jgi:hypothetical protein